MFVFGLRPSTIDSMSEGSLSQAWEMLAIAPTAQNRRRAWLVGPCERLSTGDRPTFRERSSRIWHACYRDSWAMVMPPHRRTSAILVPHLPTRVPAPPETMSFMGGGNFSSYSVALHPRPFFEGT